MAYVVPGAIERPNVIDIEERRTNSLGFERKKYSPPPKVDERLIEREKLSRIGEIMHLLDENQDYTDHHWLELVLNNPTQFENPTKDESREMSKLITPPIKKGYRTRHPRKIKW
jgi:hypothetical protein